MFDAGAPFNFVIPADEDKRSLSDILESGLVRQYRQQLLEKDKYDLAKEQDLANRVNLSRNPALQMSGEMAQSELERFHNPPAPVPAAPVVEQAAPITTGLDLGTAPFSNNPVQNQNLPPDLRELAGKNLSKDSRLRMNPRIPPFAPQPVPGLPQQPQPSSQQQPQGPDPYQILLDLQKQKQESDRAAMGLAGARAADPFLADMATRRSTAMDDQIKNAENNRDLYQYDQLNKLKVNPHEGLDVIWNRGVKAMATSNFRESLKGYNDMLSGLTAAVNKVDPRLADSKAYQAYFAEAAKMKPQPQMNMAGVASAPAPEGAAKIWGKDLASYDRSLDDLALYVSGMKGPNKQKFLDDTYAEAYKFNPQFSPADARIGFKQAEDKVNNRVLGLINSIQPNFALLKSMSDRIERSGIKLASRAEMAASRQFSNEDLAVWDKLTTLGIDELNLIFSPGGGSNQSRDMATSLLDQTLPAETFGKTLDIIETAMDNRKKGIESLSRGYHGPTLPPAGAPGGARTWIRDKKTGKLVIQK